MSERKNPDTSLAAFRALTPEKLNGDYKKIINALMAIGSGTYENISDYLNCREPNVVSRRLSELEKMEIIWKPGEKRLTKRNRQAYVYQLTGKMAKTESELPKELKTVSNTHISNGNEPKINDNGSRQGNLWFFD